MRINEALCVKQCQAHSKSSEIHDEDDEGDFVEYFREITSLGAERGDWRLWAIGVENNHFFPPILHNYALFSCPQLMSHKLVLLMLLGGFLESLKAKT